MEWIDEWMDASIDGYVMDMDMDIDISYWLCFLENPQEYSNAVFLQVRYYNLFYRLEN